MRYCSQLQIYEYPKEWTAKITLMYITKGTIKVPLSIKKYQFTFCC